LARIRSSDLAEVISEQERFADSVSVYSQALEMKPQDWAAILGRGEAFVGLGDLRDAVVAYQQLLSGDPERAKQLLGSIKGWVDYQKANPGAFGEDDIEEVVRWVAEQERTSS
jgi:tetratricopeptide (TPR) repeat protein